MKFIKHLLSCRGLFRREKGGLLDDQLVPLGELHSKLNNPESDNNFNPFAER